MKGRKPTPTAIRRLSGLPSKIGPTDSHPEPSQGIPHRPAWLDGDAVAVWNRTVPILTDMGLLTLADEAMLAGYCQAFSRVAQAEAEIVTNGLTERDGQGNLKSNPAVRMADQARKELRSFASELGLSPTARARLTVAGGKGDNLEQFLEAKRTG